MRYCFLMTMLAILPVLVWADPGASPHPVQKDLKDVGKNIEREKRMLKKLKRQSTSLLQTVSDIEREIKKSEEEVLQAEQRLADLGQTLTEHRQRREESVVSLEEYRRQLRRRLRTLYKMGEYGWMNVIFGSRSVEEGLERIRWLQRRARTDSNLVTGTRRLQEVLQVSEREIRGQTSRQKKLLQQVQQRRKEARMAKDEKARALGLLQREEALHRKAFAELKRARRRLGKVISTIEGEGSVAKGFASWKGRLKSPVSGARIEVSFGIKEDPRFKTVTRQQGVDLRAKAGIKVQAVYPGSVVFAKSFQGYGLMVIVDHGGGYYTLYAHLGKLLVKKGAAVTRGQELGTLGDTGSLKGPYLYFEVREGGRAVDPQKWVRF